MKSNKVDYLDEIIKESAKILRDNPWLSYKRAIEIAKKFYEEEENKNDN